MRRIACTLAVLGISLQPVLADDPFAQPSFAGSAFAPSSGIQSPQPQTGRSLQFFSASSKEADADATPQKFTRSDSSDPGSRKQPGDELKNYYSELFGNQPAGDRLEETAGNPARLKTLSAQTNDTKVIQAEYRHDGTKPEALIQQVSAKAEARPFPSLQPASQAPVVTQPVAEAATKTTAQSGASLTTPIQFERTVSAPATTPTTATGGSLNFINAPRSEAKLSQEYTRSIPAARSGSSTQTPSVSIEWVKKSNINVGQECQCDLVVKNTGLSSAKDIVVEAHFPKNVRLVNATPSPAESSAFLGWNFADLKPGEEKVIQVTMIPLQRGSIETHADVRFSASASGVFTVAEPLLAVKLDGPGEVLIGEPAPVTVTINNPGTGIAQNVVIEALIPDGLEHTRGKRLLMELGSLNPSESRSVRLALSATQGGRHLVQVQTRGGNDLIQNSSTEVSVISPSLITKIDGPGLRYLGRQGKFVLQVGNDGEAASNNVRVMYKIPEGFKFVAADRGAEFDTATGLLNWFVGRLEKSQKAQMTVTLEATHLGKQTHLVRATTEHGSMQDSELVTDIEGTSSLSIEVVDLDDPVETGSEAIYEIRVKNEGSAPARNVGVACELAPGMQYISAEGPSAHIAEKGQVVFRAIPELGPEKTTTFRVHVTSQATGHSRFRAHLSSESVAEPLTAEELTKFYGE